jgi:uncharacterized protein (DUF983 family)
MGIEITTGQQETRDLRRSIGRGLLCRCPRCGEGKLFSAFLKVNRVCPVCGEELFHHRADDLPPYLSIVIVGHILVFLMLDMEVTMQVEPVTYLWTMLPLAIVLPLALLQPIKGGVVGLQWANRMHGFDPTVRDPAEPDEL